MVDNIACPFNLTQLRSIVRSTWFSDGFCGNTCLGMLCLFLDNPSIRVGFNDLLDIETDNIFRYTCRMFSLQALDRKMKRSIYSPMMDK